MNAGVQSVSKKPPTTRSGSTDSTTSTESSASSTTVTKQTSSITKQTTKPEAPQSSSRSRGSIELVAEKKPFQSRFLPNHSITKKDDTESSSSEEETTSEESDDDEEEEVLKSNTTINGSGRDPRVNRSSQSRDSHTDVKRGSRDEVNSSRAGGYNSPTYARDSEESKSTVKSSPRSRATQHNEYEDQSSRYGPASSR